MSKLYYCLDCKRIFINELECQYCNGHNVKELFKNSSVNILGSKLKGRVLKIEEKKASLIIIDENKRKLIREYEAEKLRKIL